MIRVISPVYDGGRFIKWCIKVVIDQGCPDVEHIIIDGSSTDKTVEMIKRHAEKHPTFDGFLRRMRDSRMH